MDSALTDINHEAILDRIAKLEERVSDLTGLLQSLAVSAKLTEDEPFEATCVRHLITGEQRSALQMQIAIMLARRAAKALTNTRTICSLSIRRLWLPRPCLLHH